MINPINAIIINDSYGADFKIAATTTNGEMSKNIKKPMAIVDLDDFDNVSDIRSSEKALSEIAKLKAK